MELINTMMHPDPQLRPSIEEILMHRCISKHALNTMRYSKTCKPYKPQYQNEGCSDENWSPNLAGNVVTNFNSEVKQSNLG